MTKSDIYLTRYKDTGTETLGFLTIWNGYRLEAFTTIELPWKENQIDISCIPAGVYEWKKWVSPTKGLVIEILRVPDRYKILLHVANFVRELLGCISVGMSANDIDGDGNIDTVSSRKALDRMLSLLPENGQIFINYINQ